MRAVQPYRQRLPAMFQKVVDHLPHIAVHRHRDRRLHGSQRGYRFHQFCECRWCLGAFKHAGPDRGDDAVGRSTIGVEPTHKSIFRNQGPAQFPVAWLRKYVSVLGKTSHLLDRGLQSPFGAPDVSFITGLQDICLEMVQMAELQEQRLFQCAQLDAGNGCQRVLPGCRLLHRLLLTYYKHIICKYMWICINVLPDCKNTFVYRFRGSDASVAVVFCDNASI